MAKHLEGKVVIVTGSGQGIGRGIAVGLAREGAKVLTNNRKPKGYSASQFRREDMPEEDWKELCRLKGDAEMTAEIISSEGGVFDAMTGRYDRANNFDVYLKAHCGDFISIDRIGRKSNHVESPRLTMALAVQPDVIQGLMGNATLRGRGLCGRFLYAVCRSKVGRRKVSPPPHPG